MKKNEPLPPRRITFMCPGNIADHMVVSAKRASQTLTQEICDRLEYATGITPEYPLKKKNGRPLRESKPC